MKGPTNTRLIWAHHTLYLDLNTIEQSDWQKKVKKECNPVFNLTFTRDSKNGFGRKSNVNDHDRRSSVR